MELKEFGRLVRTVARLRDPERGCPWDLKQTHGSLLRHLLEEAYELMEAVRGGDPAAIREELGDVLLQCLLHARIASEAGDFDIESVARGLREKLVRRHPHVFGGGEGAKDDGEALERWREAKRKERGGVGERLLSKRDLMAPALAAALGIGRKARGAGFDWDGAGQVSWKVEEEWQELKEELAREPGPGDGRVEEEMGDLLFSCAQLARHLGLDPEEALRKANEKFIRRFNRMEDGILADGRRPGDLSLTEMDAYWDRVKKEPGAPGES